MWPGGLPYRSENSIHPGDRVQLSGIKGDVIRCRDVAHYAHGVGSMGKR